MLIWVIALWLSFMCLCKQRWLLQQSWGCPCPKGFPSVQHQLGRAGHCWPLSTAAKRGKTNEEKLPDFIFSCFNRTLFLVPPFLRTEALGARSSRYLSFISTRKDKVLALSISAVCSALFTGALQMCSNIAIYTFTSSEIPALNPIAFCFLLLKMQRKN